jgi:DNA-binding MarR family transcriptional regulator
MAERLPLPTLLSQALVAFTIEFDNEFEHRVPHWTTAGGRPVSSSHGLWLTSMVMWLNCMRYVGEEWMPVRELERLARTATNLNGMRRWRYINLEPAPGDSRVKPPAGDLLVRATNRGRRAQEVWRSLDGVIEQRWRDRFGHAKVDSLTASLVGLVSELDGSLPDCMPILGYGLFTSEPTSAGTTAAGNAAADLALPALLARPLVAFAMEFESEFQPRVSLAISADVLRVLDERPIRLQELPRMSGVSREAIDMALGILEKRRLTLTEPDPAASRGKVVRLTGAGVKVREALHERAGALETRWAERFGGATIEAIRTALESLVGDPGTASPLFAGLVPYPDGWRASVPKPETLPHFPMVLHRGGYPDGS